MLYYLFKYLEDKYDFLGAGVFQYISFRASMATVLSLLIGAIWGKKLIRILKNMQVGESIRNLGLEGQMQKQGTPTMGGFIILASILIPTLLFARLDNVYVILLIVTTVWLGLIGFLDDYIKVFRKNKEGLQGKFKIIGQVGIGLIVGLTLYFNNHVVVRKYFDPQTKTYTSLNSDVVVKKYFNTENNTYTSIVESPNYKDEKSMITTVPFFKNNELSYEVFNVLENPNVNWIIYVVVVIGVVTFVSNGANMTDGIDGLAAGTSAIIGLTIAILAYVSGNSIFSQYLNIMYIPNLGELVIFCAAFTGACVGFLWYNSYPAQVFMGDTGSLTLGGIIAVLALCIRKELLIPVLCGIFLIENFSVIIQVGYFKYTKKRYGEGRRVFKMSPLHHHYQKLGYHESKIVMRFFIVGILLAILTLATLKLQ